MSISARPSAAFTAILTNAPQGLAGILTLGIRALPSEDVVSAASTADITETVMLDATSNYEGTRTAPADAGQYEVVWLYGATEVTESLVVSGVDFGTEVTPTLADVSAILHARLRARGGADVVVFGPTTNPTGDVVETLIAQQAPMVLMDVGDTSDTGLPCASADVVRAAIRTLIAQRVAAVIELSYWPEEVATTQTAEDFWRQIVEIDQPRVVQAARECRLGEVVPGDEGESLQPVYNFRGVGEPVSTGENSAVVYPPLDPITRPW